MHGKPLLMAVGIQQEAIIARAVEDIPRQGCVKTRCWPWRRYMPKNAGPVKAKLLANLEYHLRRYTRRNTSDFFIHKDLKGSSPANWTFT